MLFALMIAFADILIGAHAIHKQLKFVLRQPKPVHIITDSKNMFEIISKENRTGEKQIMVDTYATRKAYKVKEMSSTAFVKSPHNLPEFLS